jgi:hypothetical protein
MALTSVDFLLRAREAKEAADAARMLPELSDLFLQIARSYEALADNEEWLEGKRVSTRAASGIQRPPRAWSCVQQR